MGLFKKPNRKFRQRVTRTDSEDEGASSESPENKEKQPTAPNLKEKPCTSSDFRGGVSVVPAAAVAPTLTSVSVSSLKEAEKVDPSLPKPSKLLSFHDDEDESEVFKLKKSNYSRRLAKQREKERKKREESLAGPSVNKEPQEHKSTFPSSKVTDKSKLHKIKSDESWNVIAGNEAEDMDVDSDEEKEKTNPFKNVLQSGIIPDAATIYAMKKHRQKAREMGDFIPVEEPEEEDESKSRLIREDDNDRSDDDEDDEPSRLNFTVNTGAVERQKIRETFLSLQECTQDELENEDAAALELWEREQIRKGVSVAQVGPSQNPEITENQLYAYPPPSIASYSTAAAQHVNSPHPHPMLVTGRLQSNGTSLLTTTDIEARLGERLAAVKAEHKKNEQELKDCEKEFVETTEMSKKLEKEGPELATHFSLYQQMRGYVKDLVECLDLKVAHVEMLDGKMMDLYKNRADSLTIRRQQDMRDQSDEYSILSSEILKGINAEFLSEKSNCTDEVKLRRAAEREGRRMRRRKQRERTMKMTKHHDGMSSDDEVPDADLLQFKNTRASILNDANGIFEDVVEEFGTLEGVMINFEKWKYAQLASYREAFVPLCLPKIFGTFVRVPLLDWNPLEEKLDLEKTSWFRQLVYYGCPWEKEEVLEEDPDMNLLPGIIEKIVLPKISGFVQHVWDPLSRRETANLSNLIRQLSASYPTINGKSKQLQLCLKNVSNRIYKALDDDVFIPLYPKELLENRSLKASDFFQRQFWSSVKLLQNILSWDGIIAEQPLQDMALASLLNRYLLMGLHTSITLKDTLDKCKMIVASYPKSWFKKSKSSNTQLLLKQFCAYLLKFADSYSSQSLKRGIAEDDTKEVVKDIVQLLVTMEFLDEAVSLARKYSVSAFKN